ncbi:MAG: restriction endonuclease subunit S, partial [Candidatus Poribacteria bacterium]|nr:restriction endonuclease subunit S [Candidatus Poribacteria bacterium]
MKRYPEYKESSVEWVGEIPRHWRIVRGKFLLKNQKEINSDLQCNNLLSLTLNGVLRKDMNSAEGLRPSDYKTYQVFYPDNLVFKLIDLENIQTSRVGIVPEKGVMSPVYIRLESNSDLHERYYFYQYYDLYKKHIYNFLGKGVRSSLSPSNLLEIPLAFPPPSEQTQIANFLDRKTEQIDELIRIKERRIELLQE